LFATEPINATPLAAPNVKVLNYNNATRTCSIKIFWKKNPDAVKYVIQREKRKGRYSQKTAAKSKNIGTTYNTYYIDNVKAGAVYDYQYIAYNKKGRGFNYSKWGRLNLNQQHLIGNAGLQSQIRGQKKVVYKANIISLPDLTTENFCHFFPKKINHGATLTINNIKIKNNGKKNAGPFKVVFYLYSTHNSLDRQYFGAKYIKRLDKGKSKFISMKIVIPKNVKAGNYYIGWKVDKDKEIKESNENNNSYMQKKS